MERFKENPWKDALGQQIRRNRHLNYFSPSWPEDLEVAPEFRKSLTEWTGSGQELAPIRVDALIRRTKVALYEVNPYLHIDREADGELQNIYRETERRIPGGNVAEICLDHHTRLADWVTELFPRHFREPLTQRRRLGSVTYAGYSSDRQVEVLGGCWESWRDPIVDVGCGPTATLVRALRRRGRRAFGMDRLVESPESWLIEGDWLDYDFGRRRWGTVVSHLAFSTHARYCMENHGALAARYRESFRRILESLKPGGSFLYVPSLAEMEGELDRSQFTLQRHPLYGEWFSSRITRIH